MNPFQPPHIPFPDGVSAPSGTPLGLGMHVHVRVARRTVEGEIVGWRMPDRIRILTDDCHLHTVSLEALLDVIDQD
jgi:hypothetical protein